MGECRFIFYGLVQSYPRFVVEICSLSMYPLWFLTCRLSLTSHLNVTSLPLGCERHHPISPQDPSPSPRPNSLVFSRRAEPATCARWVGERHPLSVCNICVRFIPSPSDRVVTRRWDLRGGQRGQIERIPVAHAGAILALDWYSVLGPTPGGRRPASGSGGTADGDGKGGDKELVGGTGWIASAGMDRTVKVLIIPSMPWA
jgi:hypothetical protein